MLQIKIVYSIVLFSVHRILALESRLDELEMIPIEKAPFVALVLCTNSKYFCSGTILNGHYVLSSAHCFYDLTGMLTEDDPSVLVVAGTAKLSNAAKDINNGNAQIRRSDRLLVHDSYNYLSNFIFDVALIHLSEPLETTRRVAGAPLHPQPSPLIKRATKWYYKKKNSPDNTCTVYGFGKVYLNKSNVNDDSLKKQMLNVSKNCECLNYVWNLIWHHSVRTVIFICEADTAKDATLSGLCSGDQGAPLICDDALVGIGTTAFNYLSKDECRYRTYGVNECGDVDTMYVFTDLCPISHWLGYYVPEFPISDDTCQPYV